MLTWHSCQVSMFVVAAAPCSQQQQINTDSKTVLHLGIADLRMNENINKHCEVIPLEQRELALLPHASKPKSAWLQQPSASGSDFWHARVLQRPVKPRRLHDS